MKIVFWNQTFKRTQNKSELKEDRVIKFKDGWIQIMQSEKQNEKMKNKVRDLWATMEYTNKQVMGFLKRGKKE